MKFCSHVLSGKKIFPSSVPTIFFAHYCDLPPSSMSQLHAAESLTAAFVCPLETLLARRSVAPRFPCRFRWFFRDFLVAKISQKKKLAHRYSTHNDAIFEAVSGHFPKLPSLFSIYVKFWGCSFQPGGQLH